MSASILCRWELDGEGAMVKSFITAEEAKKNVESHSLDTFHTMVGLYGNREDNYKKLLAEIDWAVRKESHIGHSQVIVSASAPSSLEEAVDIYRAMDFLENRGFTVYRIGTIKGGQVELVVEW